MVAAIEVYKTVAASWETVFYHDLNVYHKHDVL